MYKLSKLSGLLGSHVVYVTYHVPLTEGRLKEKRKGQNEGMREAPGEDAQRSGFVSCKYACRRLKSSSYPLPTKSYVADWTQIRFPPSSETQGQLVGAGRSLNGRETNSGEEKSRTRFFARIFF